MSLHQPPADWFKAPTGAERMWIGLALIWCIVLFSDDAVLAFFRKTE